MDSQTALNALLNNKAPAVAAADALLVNEKLVTSTLSPTAVKQIRELRALHAVTGEVLVGHYDDEALFNHYAALPNADHHIDSPINPINPARAPWGIWPARRSISANRRGKR